MYKMPTQLTPYSLLYGVKVVLPLKIQILAFHITIEEGLSKDENHKLRLAKLESLNEKCLKEQQKLKCYQAHLSRASTKKVRSFSF